MPPIRSASGGLPHQVTNIFVEKPVTSHDKFDERIIQKIFE
jgi:hypothetical protein